MARMWLAISYSKFISFVPSDEHINIPEKLALFFIFLYEVENTSIFIATSLIHTLTSALRTSIKIFVWLNIDETLYDQICA